MSEEKQGENKHVDVLNEFEERSAKITRLVEAGVAPYPANAQRTHTIAEALAGFDNFARTDEVAGEGVHRITEMGTEMTLVGRLYSKRQHGNLTFADLRDGSGTLQLAFSKRDIGADAYKTLTKLVDRSDFVEVEGVPFTTRVGVQSLRVTRWRLLTKALRSVPTEHFGLTDDEERYRKRYLALLLDENLRARFVRRAQFWRVMRQFMTTRDFMEVETPTLEVTTGGAEARPFATKHNDYDMDVFMRISIGELWQKRLMASGFEKTFEIGRAYRNEGTSPNHLQEFTNMECYWAYADYNDGMSMVQEMYRTLAQEVYGTTRFTAHGHTFDLADDWTQIDYVAEVTCQTGVDVLTATVEELRAKLDALGVKYDVTTRERLVDNLWKCCRRSIAGPAFLVNHPVFLAPLSKRKEDNPAQVEKFQVILAGAEVGNGYSELNDPIDQRARFEAQQKLLEAGDDEAMMPDWEFVEMLEYGMPPTCGFGVGERLFAFLEGVSLRDATLFPLMKPKG